MAVKRSRRSAATRPRKRMRRMIARPRRAPRGSFLLAKRTFWLSHWQPNTSTVDGFWRYYTFTLGQLPSASEFTALFDAYKISAIKLTFRPRYDNFAGNDTTDTALPGITNNNGTMMHIIRDPRSTVAPSGTYTSATLNQFLENGGGRSYMGTKPINIYFKPMNDTAIATGATAAVRSRVSSRWLNTANTDVVHYGVHVFAQDVNFTGLFGNAFDVFVTYYMKFKSLR